MEFVKASAVHFAAILLFCVSAMALVSAFFGDVAVGSSPSRITIYFNKNRATKVAALFFYFYKGFHILKTMPLDSNWELRNNFYTKFHYPK